MKGGGAQAVGEHSSPKPRRSLPTGEQTRLLRRVPDAASQQLDGIERAKGIARQALGRCTLLTCMEMPINSDKDRDSFMRCWAYVAYSVTNHLFCTSQDSPPLQAAPRARVLLCYRCFPHVGEKMEKKNKICLSSKKATLLEAADNLQSYANIIFIECFVLWIWCKQ